jgi:hypothetical protein
MKKFSGNLREETLTFHKILYAIYAEPYNLDSFEELERLTAMADYYCVLRIVSRSIDAALRRSPVLVRKLRKHAFRGMELAEKLRNTTLFEDCLILSIGPWNSPSFEYAVCDDDKLYRIAVRARNSIAGKLDSIHRSLLDEATKSKEVGKELMDVAKEAQQEGRTGSVQLALYYRLLSKSDVLGSASPTRTQIDSLLENQLNLIHGGKAGKEKFESYFLCSPDENANFIPWDDEDTDW